MKHILFASLLFIAFSASAQIPIPAGLDSVFIVSVYDGDGCRARFPDGVVRPIRFCGASAPDRGPNYYVAKLQPYALQSRDSLRALVLNKWVYIDTRPYGKVVKSYGRIVADLYLPDGTLVNLFIVQHGWAWSRPAIGRVSPLIYQLMEDAESRAKTNKLGIHGIKGMVLDATWKKRWPGPGVKKK